MLKIEKIGRRGDITITVRDKECVWNRGFVIALLAALGFHLGAIILFHISPFKLVNGSILPPAFVETDTKEPEGAIISNVDSEGPVRYLLAPKVSIPEIPEIPKLAVLRHLEFYEGVRGESMPFESLEHQMQNESMYEARILESQSTPIQIQVAGPLAALSYHGMDLGVLPAEGNFRALFAVQVENKTGQVFWLEPKEMIADPKYQKLAEKILRSLIFERDAQNFVTEGEIEISFYAKEGRR